MYFQFFWAVCIAVDQFFLWPCVLLRSRKLRSTIWGLQSYTSLASQPGYRSSVWFCQFIGLLGSLFIISHANGCKISIKSGNLESGAKNSTCFLSSRYIGVVRAAPKLSHQSWVCICKLVGLFGLRWSLPMKMFASLQYTGDIYNLEPESHHTLPLCILE